MTKQLLIILPVLYLFYAVLTVDSAGQTPDAEALERGAALLTQIGGQLQVDPDAEQLTVTAPTDAWRAMLYYPQSMQYRLTAARWSRNFQFWGGIFFASAVFAIGIALRGWTTRPRPAPPTDADAPSA